ncbi:MAG: aminotransferase class III-fold pyridoxal phosphate-dependent enzyme, partial [Alphaproteobacteria bacterium]
EAIECAIKTARRYQFAQGRPERYRIITFQSAFHGRTLACIAATDQDKLRAGFAPLPDWFDVVPFADLEAAAAAISPATGAILIEPVQGEGGIKVAPPAMLRALRALADRHDLMLIFDEIQCGMGRTGKLFAYEHAGVAPDILATAKGIGGGFPLGACLATEKAAKGMVAGTHGSTYGGNPLACAVGNAVLDIMLAPGFFDQVAATGAVLRERLDGLVRRHADVFDSVRGLGLMLGLKLKVPVADMIAAVREQALLAAPAGDNVMRLLPPLTIGAAEIAEALDKLEAAARACTPAGRSGQAVHG